MATETGRIGRVENRVDNLFEKTGRLAGTYKHLATKQDIAELRGIKTGPYG